MHYYYYLFMFLEKVKNYSQKIKIKKLLEIIVCIILLSAPLFYKFFNTEKEFVFQNIEDEEIFILPEDSNKVYSFLNNTKESLDITIYMLSDRKAIEIIKKLFRNNIKIRIIIEQTPYGGSGVNYKTYNELNELGIDIKYSNPRFALTHAKYMIQDNKTAFIMTSNMTYSGLNGNRDFILKTSEDRIVRELKNIFDHDFQYKKYKPKEDNVVASPVNSRDKMETIIKSATKSIYIYGENIGDKEFENLLMNKAKNGLDIKIILPDSKSISSNNPVIDKLRANNIIVKNLKKPYQHAKIIIADNKIMYLGSVNYSTYSMDKNREIGIITINNKSIQKVLETFNNDFK